MALLQICNNLITHFILIIICFSNLSTWFKPFPWILLRVHYDCKMNWQARCPGGRVCRQRFGSLVRKVIVCIENHCLVWNWPDRSGLGVSLSPNLFVRNARRVSNLVSEPNQIHGILSLAVAVIVWMFLSMNIPR